MNKAHAALLSIILLAGCDNPEAPKPTQDQSNKESASFSCKNGSVSTECEITTGDQLGSGKWRHAKLNLSGSNVSLNVDGEVFIQTNVGSSFVDGERVTSFELKSVKGSRAEVSLYSSNSRTRLSVDAWNVDDKLMMTSSR